MKCDFRLHSATLVLWSIQDSLLQWYRSIFITSQALLVSFAATLATTDYRVLVLPLAVIGLTMVYFWRAICFSRGRDVAFCQWLLMRCEAGLTPEEQASVDRGLVTVFKEFQTTQQFAGRSLPEDCAYATLLDSKTRVRMDRQVPCVFVSVWVILVLFVFYLLRSGFI